MLQEGLGWHMGISWMKAEKVNPVQRDLVKNGSPVDSAMCLGTVGDDVARTEKVQQELLLPLDVELGGRLRHREVLVIPQGHPAGSHRGRICYDPLLHMPVLNFRYSLSADHPGPCPYLVFRTWS